MLAEFFEALRNHAREGSKLEIVPIPGDPRNVLFVQNGKFESQGLPRPIIKDTIHSFCDVLDCADANHGDNDPAAVYYDEAKIIVVHDADDTYDRSTMPVRTSERWAAVLKLGEGFAGTQKEAIHFLRFGLGLDRLDPVLAGIRKLDFVRQSTGKNTTEHGRESMGRSVEMQVQQADAIPEQFDVTVRPLVNTGLQGLTVTVSVGVVLDLEGQRVIFRALPDEIPRARSAWLCGIGALLRERSGDTFRVIHGSP